VQPNSRSIVRPASSFRSAWPPPKATERLVEAGQLSRFPRVARPPLVCRFTIARTVRTRFFAALRGNRVARLKQCVVAVLVGPLERQRAAAAGYSTIPRLTWPLSLRQSQRSDLRSNSPCSLSIDAKDRVSPRCHPTIPRPRFGYCRFMKSAGRWTRVMPRSGGGGSWGGGGSMALRRTPGRARDAPLTRRRYHRDWEHPAATDKGPYWGARTSAFRRPPRTPMFPRVAPERESSRGRRTGRPRQNVGATRAGEKGCGSAALRGTNSSRRGRVRSRGSLPSFLYNRPESSGRWFAG
jgi:hypothetical protein